MAIQGATDAFGVRSLLEFLAATSRTGRLVVHAGTSVGLVAVREGNIVAGGVAAGAIPPNIQAAPSAPAMADVLFDLAASGPGRFAFHEGGVGGTATGFAINEVLRALDVKLGERPVVDDLVARPDRVVVLEHEVSFRKLRIDEEQWQLVVAIGSGATLSQLAVRLGVGTYSIGRRLVDLVHIGLVRIEGWTPPELAEHPAAIEPATVDEPTAAIEPLATAVPTSAVEPPTSVVPPPPTPMLPPPGGEPFALPDPSASLPSPLGEAS